MITTYSVPLPPLPVSPLPWAGVRVGVGVEVGVRVGVGVGVRMGVRVGFELSAGQ